MRVAVLYGGMSSEREVSLKSGEGVIEAVKRNGFEVFPVLLNTKEDIQKLIDTKVDIVVNVLHGGIGEDGTIQALMDFYGIPYIGTTSAASALAMDKWKSKRMVEKFGIPVANDTLYKEGYTYGFGEGFSLPVIVKPNREGSTVGLNLVTKDEELNDALDFAKQYDKEVIVEECVFGREVTVGVWGEMGKEEALPVVEIVSKNELYDYEAKYTKGMSEHLVPAEFPKEIYEEIQEYAVRAHQVLGCRTYSRVDFIVQNDTNKPYFLEVNTQPGMTETSLFPDAARELGYSYDDLVKKLIEIGLQNQ
ncbi:D-alanine--D-alanine ligase [Bacillus cereus]|uniref:D-alanine--D-alanine ligase n=1 Tax=Bacillus cereus TaxID=1396 RepID=A0A162PIR0_BACCE|nr:D-alanine--D-alanine ligase [Bacillus cereus]KZD72149.1 D-alanine--D-alanine ligase [Bacillus cereus]